MKKLSVQQMSDNTVQGLTILGRIHSDKLFSLKDTGIDSKIFHVWKAKGLVDFIERGKWARLNLIDYLWLQVLETMRKFGCSVKCMKEIYDELFTKAFKENLAAKNLKSYRDYYTNLKKLRTLTSDESEVLDIIEYLDRNPILNMQFRNTVSYFSKLVSDCLKYKADAGLIIFEDGSFKTFSDSLGEETGVNAKPHIYIPLANYILEFIGEEDKQDFLIRTGLLSEDEYRVIREIRNKNVKSITITFEEKEHKVEKIECNKKGTINGDDAKKVMSLLGLKNYSGIELNTRDGKTLSFTHTEKKFF